MMTNLFSTFDPVSSLLMIQINWTSLFMFLVMIYPLIWVVNSKVIHLWFFILNFVTKEFIMIFNNYKNIILFNALFVFILLNNLMGLMPYTFTATAHMALTLGLALLVWFAIILFGWINFTNNSFAHLVPLGTPPVLMPFMVIIETVSNIIRPITLSVRLAANMTAGHILLVLLGNNMTESNFVILIILIITQAMLLLLEMAVAMIQSYVFATLSTLYASEI